MEMLIGKSGERRKCTKEFSLVLKLIMIVNLTGAAELRGWKRMVNQNSNFQIIRNKNKKVCLNWIKWYRKPYHALHLPAQENDMSFFFFFQLNPHPEVFSQTTMKKARSCGINRIGSRSPIKSSFFKSQPSKQI